MIAGPPLFVFTFSTILTGFIQTLIDVFTAGVGFGIELKTFLAGAFKEWRLFDFVAFGTELAAGVGGADGLTVLTSKGPITLTFVSLVFRRAFSVVFARGVRTWTDLVLTKLAFIARACTVT